jgi:hypothetical protein
MLSKMGWIHGNLVEDYLPVALTNKKANRGTHHGSTCFPRIRIMGRNKAAKNN